MFYVVFLRKSKKNVIIPLEWVDDDEAQLEKFMNYGINSNQAFRCFYSEKPAMLDQNGIPKAVAPNFEEYPVDGSVFPNDGCYMGKILKFKTKYEDAKLFVESRRQINPPLYNEERLLEKPIPQVKDLVSENTSALANMLIELEPLIMLGLIATTKKDSLAHSTANIRAANKTDSLAPSSIGDHEEHSCVHSTTGSSAIAIPSTRNDADVSSSPQEFSEQSIEVENSVIMELDPLAESIIGDQAIFTENLSVHSTTDSSAIENSSAIHGGVHVNTSIGNQTLFEENSIVNSTIVSSAIENSSAIHGGTHVNTSIGNQTLFEEDAIVNSTIVSSTAEISSVTHGITEVNHSSIQTEDLATMGVGLDAVSLAHSSLSLNIDAEEKYFVPLVEPGTDQYIEILDLLQDKEIVVVSDDITITMDSSGMPQPMKTTIDGLIKREADIISSNIPFNVTKSGHRLYKIDGRMYTIPKKVIDTFLIWNECEDYQTPDYDKRFVHALLVSLVDEELLSNFNLKKETIDFVTRLFTVRVRGQVARIASLPRYVDELCSLKKRSKKF